MSPSVPPSSIVDLKYLVQSCLYTCPVVLKHAELWESIEPWLNDDNLALAIERYSRDFTGGHGLMMKEFVVLGGGDGDAGRDYSTEWQTTVGRLACVFYRLQRVLFEAKAPERQVLIPLAIALNHATRCSIAYSCDIGEGLTINHGDGCHLAGAGVRIGRDFTMYQNVTVGVDHLKKAAGRPCRPTIGDGVTMGAGAMVIGAVLVGDGATIGAGTTVVRDVPARSTVVSSPNRIICDDGR